jgi:acetolactate synthase I/II/III large subunit
VTHTYRGADAVAHALTRAGVKRIFTLSGNHILPLFDAAQDLGIELIHTRHEAAAVHMADAWARLTGEPGVAAVTAGPGHGNAISALYTAQMSESPVVLVSGQSQAGQQGGGAFQEMRQAEMAAPVTKLAWTSVGPNALGRDIARAITTAASGRPGPVQLNLPVDALDAASRPDTVPGEDAFRWQPMSLDTATARAILDRLTRASRPVVLTGPACLTKAGDARMRTLEEAAGIPVVGIESPRGTKGPSLGCVGDLLAQADCVLLVGKRVDYTLGFAKPPGFSPTCEFIQIDADDAEVERARRTLGSRLTRSVSADAFSAIACLTSAAATHRPAHAAWLADVRSALAYRPAAWRTAASKKPGLLHPAQVCLPLQAMLDAHPDSVVVLDGGEFGQWAQGCLTAPNRVINGPAGAIGAMLPMALAARVAKPDVPIIVLMGDGAFGFHVSEFDTAVRYRLPVVAIVGNDARWNAEYQLQVKNYGRDRTIGCDLLPTRYDLVAAGFGAHAEHVDTPDGVMPAAIRAQRSGLPSCLNVAIEGVPAPIVTRRD